MRISQTRRRQAFNFDWRFLRGDRPGAHQLKCNDRKWENVQLPHDWAIQGPQDAKAPAWGSGGWYPGGVAWYRKTFDVPATDAGKLVRIEFDGVYHNCDVWVNGSHVGRHDYGYIGFHFDITGHLRFGQKNVIAVRVDNSDQPNCRWYSGSGIYRNVWLTTLSAIHVAHWGTYVTTPKITPSQATLKLRTRVQGPAGCSAVLATEIVDPHGTTVASAITKPQLIEDGERTIEQSFKIKHPELWSLSEPNLYEARTSVLAHDAGALVDRYTTAFGIREARFDRIRGFLLNGEPLKLKGVNLHHDGGSVGAAVPIRVWERRFEILKSIGCNAVRFSHNPPAPEVLDLCDRMGFLAIDEAFDKWEGDFAKPDHWWMRQGDFSKNWERDLRSMLRRDGNHPSIVLWSVGNETGSPGTDEVNPTLRRLVRFTRLEEPSRPITAAFVNSFAPTIKQRVQRILSSGRHVDVLCLNYQEPIYPLLRKKDPNAIIIGSEVFKHFRGGALNVHSYEPVNPWHDVEKHDYVVGSFLWPGIDYLGEATVFPIKGWPHGILDTCGFLKPEGWFHRSVWNSDPLVRIAVLDDGRPAHLAASSWGAPPMVEHWNLDSCKGKLVRLQTQTNCQTVELLLDGKSFGERKSADYPNRAIPWFVPYVPGKLEAVARNRGKVVATHALETTGAAAKLVLSTDRRTLLANGEDIAHITLQVVDAGNRPVRHDERQVRIGISGAGQVLGIDNGDLTCPESYRADLRTTRAGRLLILVQATRSAGPITLTAGSPGLTKAVLRMDGKRKK